MILITGYRYDRYRRHAAAPHTSLALPVLDPAALRLLLARRLLRLSLRHASALHRDTVVDRVAGLLARAQGTDDDDDACTATELPARTETEAEAAEEALRSDAGSSASAVASPLHDAALAAHRHAVELFAEPCVPLMARAGARGRRREGMAVAAAVQRRMAAALGCGGHRADIASAVSGNVSSSPPPLINSQLHYHSHIKVSTSTSASPAPLDPDALLGVDVVRDRDARLLRHRPYTSSGRRVLADLALAGPAPAASDAASVSASDVTAAWMTVLLLGPTPLTCPRDAAQLIEGITMRAGARGAAAGEAGG